MFTRKFVAVGAAAFLCAGIFAGAAHGTGPAKIDVAHDNVRCTSVYGSATFTPGLQLLPTKLTPSKIAIKGVVGNCTVTGPNPAVIAGGTFAGTLSLPNNTATGLLGLEPATGTLTIKWKADKTTPIVQASTIVTPKAICGGTIVLPNPLNDFYALFHFGAQPNCATDGQQPAASATGAFTGNDSGASFATDAVTVQTITALTPEIQGAGVAGVNIALGTLSVG